MAVLYSEPALPKQLPSLISKLESATSWREIYET